MEALTTQNSELRTMLIKATEVKPRSGENGSENGDQSQTDDLVSFCYNQRLFLLVFLCSSNLKI